MAFAGVEKMEDRPAYVRFERVPVEDAEKSRSAGHYVARDVDYALITPAYTKDVMKYEVGAWFKKMEHRVQTGRLKPEYLKHYKSQYEAFKDGAEPPLEGLPVKGWSMISPAMQETLHRMNIKTVEDAALMNEDAIRRIGMGAVDVKQKAIATLKGANDTGKLAMENAQLKSKLEVAEANVEKLTADLNELAAYVKAHMAGAAAAAEAPATPEAGLISASDLMDEPEPDKPRRGRPPKVKE